MFTDQAKKTAFNKSTIDDWQKAVRTVLKSTPLEELYGESYEGIRLSPLYTQTYKNIDQYPGEESYTYIRGFHPPDKKPCWRIAQKLNHLEWEQCKVYIQRAFERGQEAVALDLELAGDIEKINFFELDEIVDLDRFPLLIFAGSQFESITEKLLAFQKRNVDGVVAADIVTEDLSSGLVISPDSELIKNWMLQIKRLDQAFPRLRTILIDVKPFKNSGAHAVQELGLSLASAVFYIEQMKSVGWSPEKTASKLSFHFAIGGSFFMEFSKFRAFRMLWKTIADAYNISSAHHFVPISAETADFTKSVLDPYVNMLRAGNEAFAAILGGVDYLHVAPFDELTGQPSDLSRRIAGNTQLILRDESLLDHIIDPAGGSYYIEALTGSLVEKGWRYFQEIDRKGGIIQALQSGWIQKEIQTIVDKRDKDLETRRYQAIGVNVYALGNEQLQFPSNRSSVKTENGKIKVQKLPNRRLAEKFEHLRKRSSDLAQKGEAPSAGIICLGELKAYKPLADFVSGVFAAGGIQAIWSQSCHSMEDIKDFIEESQTNYFCLCGPSILYEQFADEIGHWARKNFTDIQIDAAGKLSAEQLSGYQLDGTIYSGQNIYEKLSHLLNRWEDDRHG